MIPLYRHCTCPHLLQLAANSSQLGPSPKTRLQPIKSSAQKYLGGYVPQGWQRKYSMSCNIWDIYYIYLLFIKNSNVTGHLFLIC